MTRNEGNDRRDRDHLAHVYADNRMAKPILIAVLLCNAVSAVTACRLAFGAVFYFDRTCEPCSR